MTRKRPSEPSQKMMFVAAWFFQLRDSLRARFEALERRAAGGERLDAGKPGLFVLTPWRREEGGGGEMALLREGRLFEKAAVHVSHVYGPVPEALAKGEGGGGAAWENLPDDALFEAAGISVILHPRNPHVPAAHMNTRHIAIRTGEGGEIRAFFGGGADLTPMLKRYRDENHEDVKTFHAALKEACDTHPAVDYEAFRDWCARYFRLPHRGEARGMGGIFYDMWQSGDFDADFAFTKRVGESFGRVYETIAKRRIGTRWSEAEKREQRKWRGRYAEFNLLYDRGTRFGLRTGGNVEAILSSLPPDALWR